MLPFSLVCAVIGAISINQGSVIGGLLFMVPLAGYLLYYWGDLL